MNEAPKLTAQVDRGNVIIVFRLPGEAEALRLYCRRGADADFARLTDDAVSPFIDSRPNLAPGPEPRDYRACYVTADGEETLCSMPVSVVVD